MSDDITDLIAAMREHADECIGNISGRRFGKAQAMDEAKRFYGMADWIENVYLKELVPGE